MIKKIMQKFKKEPRGPLIGIGIRPDTKKPMPYQIPINKLGFTPTGQPSLTLYRHHKGGVYKLLCIGVGKTEGRTRMAVYQSIETGVVWVQPFARFCKKFTELKPEDSIDKGIIKTNIKDFLGDF